MVKLSCPKCAGLVFIQPMEGGRGSRDPTTYRAECDKCGSLLEYLPSNCDGKKATATAEFKRWANVEMARQFTALRAQVSKLEAENARLQLTNMTHNSPHEEAGTNWRHVKSGGLYRILGSCLIEATATPAFAYRSLDDGRVWVRPIAEFMDGRFEQIEDDDLKAREAKDGH